ncbi:hypothetical protein AMECASPLE_007796 [Ameca splendens]|uniref:Uncharacterized protein n=1 Tax=Ameca splendens TaxID=208324 RepID=A0ABV0XP03_9TELE
MMALSFVTGIKCFMIKAMHFPSACFLFSQDKTLTRVWPQDFQGIFIAAVFSLDRNPTLLENKKQIFTPAREISRVLLMSGSFFGHNKVILSSGQNVIHSRKGHPASIR